MARITYITPEGVEVVVEESGGTLMTAAVQNRVKGIIGECGGVCSCATCHVHVDPQWKDRVGLPGAVERDMLEFADGATECSRLGCQIPITEQLDGLKVRVVGQ